MPKVFKLQQLGGAIQQTLNAVGGKAEQSDLNAHTGNGDVHVSTTEKSRWNDTYTKTQVDERIEQGGKVKTVSVNGGSAVQPDEHGNIDIEVPTDLKDLNDDSTHRTVTDAEKSTWSGKQPAGDYATRTELAEGLNTKQGVGDYATNTALTEGLAGKQGTISDLDAIRSGAGKGATSVQGVKMEGDDDPLTPNGNGVVTIPQPVIPDAVTSVIANNELVLQTPDGQSVKGKVGITTGADGLLHLTLTDEEGNTYSSPIAGLRVVGNALQYSNDGETWVTVQTFGKLAIKYVQASDPVSGDVGDLALVGTTNAYVLKVYVGGSWVSVCDFGTLDLTSDGITMVGENKTLTEKMQEVDEGLDSLDVQMNGHTEDTQLNARDSSYALSKYIYKYSDTNIQWVPTTTFNNAVAVPIEPGSSIKIVGNAAKGITYAILRTCNINAFPSSQMVTGLKSLAAGGTVTVDATEDGHYLYMKLDYANNSIAYPQSVTQSIYTPGMKDQFDAMNKFQTGENLADVPIDDEPTENSNGLVKSGCLFDALKVHKILRCDTSVLSGGIMSTYSTYIISAGKKVYDEDIVVSKLIFNKNIESAATDTTFTYYVALPNSNTAGLGAAHTGTITAGTNYADVRIEVPAGKIIYVQNKKVVDGGADAVPTGCLISGWQNSGSDKSYSINPSGDPITIYAGFSYEYYTVISLKEYIDYKDDNTNQKIDKSKVLWSDAKTVFAFGSSLTDQRFAPAGHIWLEEINNLVDANIANYALSGSTLKGNISDCIALNSSPDWILWNNQANGKTESEDPELVPFGMNGYIQLANAKEVTESKGATMLLGGENGTAHGQISLVSVDRLFDVFASDNHVPRSELRRELVNAYIGNPTTGFNDGVHRGWRTQSPFITKHMELLGNLPISKSVKIYKVRPGSANLEVSALAYDTPLQRIKHFYAISTGMYSLVSQFTFAGADNIKMSSSYNATAASETRTTITDKETVTLKNGGAISIPYGKAVVEFVLDKENVSSGRFSFKCTSEPQVYVSISHNSSTESYTDNPRSTWQLVDEITYSAYNGITEVEVDGKIELGDKVKFLVVCAGSFNISKPSFEYEGGRTKKTPVLNYKPRRYGTELNSNRNIDSNDWQLGGNAAIKQIPNAIGYYNADTSHIELTDNGDYAERTVTIPAGTKKVAIRVMATRFVPVMTKRFVGTDAENSEYVSTTQVINNYDCDLGVMDIIIDDAAVSRQVICPGFAWSYVEYATELKTTDAQLKVRVRKPDDDAAPTMVYMLSVQAIE